MVQAMERLSPTKLGSWADKRATAIWTNLHANHLWQRMVKNAVATTICIIIAVIPSVVRIYGNAVYLAPMVTVFGHPGRRFGQMAEALVLATIGTIVAIGWSNFGLYLASLIYAQNESAAYTIKALFLVVSFLVHGILRSHSPRLFIGVVLLVIVSVVTLTGTAKEVSAELVTVIIYPILTAVGVLLLVNIFLFPEFSSDFLGVTTIETLGETVGVLRDAGRYFIEVAKEKSEAVPDGLESAGLRPLQSVKTYAEKPDTSSHGPQHQSLYQKLVGSFSRQRKDQKDDQTNIAKPKIVKLQDLTGMKAKLRTKLASCKAAQQECNFELAWSILPPRDLKPINDNAMKKLVANAIALVGACESKYALMGDGNDKSDGKTKPDAFSNSVENDANGSKILSSHVRSLPKSGSPETIRSQGLQKTEDDEVHWYNKKSKAKGKGEKKANSRNSSKSLLAREKEDLELIKPHKEIASGDVDLLKYLLDHISKSLSDLQENIDRSVDVVTSCLAYCYDVKKLPSGALPPKGIQLQEIDIRVDILTNALEIFDHESGAALEKAASLQSDLDQSHVDVMPRMETFLISAFILNLRQAAIHAMEMLRHSRTIVEKRQARHGRRRIYVPAINFKKWLTSGGEEDGDAVPERGRKSARAGKTNDEEVDEEDASSKETLLMQKDMEAGPRTNLPPPKPHVKKIVSISAQNNHSYDKRTSAFRLRNKLADSIEFLVGSETLFYAIKLTIAAFLVCWPAFVPSWNNWFHLNRALWACLQLVLISDVALGISIWTFILRAIGTTLGCLWGYAAYESRHGNRVVVVVMLTIGIIPSAYVQLGSKYVKAGMVSTISMCIVAIGTLDPSVPGTSTETFLRRFIAFLIGGFVALAVEILLFPVRARDRMVESLASSIQHITNMEACLAQGIESEVNVTDSQSIEVSRRFDAARARAQGALAAAETFLPFCEKEPRLKGSFQGLGLIYSEILYVLHAIVDRMGDMLHLRLAYGSGVLEEFNVQVHPYRRNVAGSITLILFAVHEGLTTKLPLPQYLPSARLAHLRLINRVRELVLETGSEGIENLDEEDISARSHLEKAMVKRIFRKKFLAWNAAAAGQIEVIEYLEELIDLVKLLVGANEFRSGMLTRPHYQEYFGRIGGRLHHNGKEKEIETNRECWMAETPGTIEKTEPKFLSKQGDTQIKGMEEKKGNRGGLLERSRSRASAQEHELPLSLQRVRSRRLEAIHVKETKTREMHRTNEEEGEAGEHSDTLH